MKFFPRDAIHSVNKPVATQPTTSSREQFAITAIRWGKTTRTIAIAFQGDAIIEVAPRSPRKTQKPEINSYNLLPPISLKKKQKL